MKKRYFSLILVFVLFGSLLAGCGKKEDVTDTPEPGIETESSVVESETSTQGEGSSQDATEVVKDEVENTESESKDEPSEEPEPPVHEHTYTETVTKEPGCYYARKDGELTYTCSCGDSYVEVLEFLPCSDLSDGIRVTVREPDCQHEGRTCEHCKYCGQELYPGTLPETEHVPSEWLEIESQGKRYKVCVNCGITLEKEELE